MVTYRIVSANKLYWNVGAIQLTRLGVSVPIAASTCSASSTYHTLSCDKAFDMQNHHSHWSPNWNEESPPYWIQFQADGADTIRLFQTGWMQPHATIKRSTDGGVTWVSTQCSLNKVIYNSDGSRGDVADWSECELQQMLTAASTTAPPDLEGLDDDELETEVDLEKKQQDLHECRKWCYSKKHHDKAWGGKKCAWLSCSTCPECTAASATTTTSTTSPAPTPAPTPAKMPNGMDRPVLRPGTFTSKGKGSNRCKGKSLLDTRTCQNLAINFALTYYPGATDGVPNWIEHDSEFEPFTSQFTCNQKPGWNEDITKNREYCAYPQPTSKQWIAEGIGGHWTTGTISTKCKDFKTMDNASPETVEGWLQACKDLCAMNVDYNGKPLPMDVYVDGKPVAAGKCKAISYLAKNQWGGQGGPNYAGCILFGEEGFDASGPEDPTSQYECYEGDFQ